MNRILIAGLALLLGTAVQAQAKDDLWFHVSVDGSGDDAERVRINLPLQLFSTILPMIEADEFHHGKVRMDDCDLDREELVAILRAVADAEPGEYVTVEDGEDTIRVAKEGKQILVNVRERGDEGDQVDIRVPVSVLEALISGDDDELDLVAAVDALAKDAKGSLITVNDEDGTLVKVWIDERNQSD